MGGKESPTILVKGSNCEATQERLHLQLQQWRGITFLSVPSKILAKIIIRRMTDAVDEQLRPEQAGFRKGRGCIDQIFALRNIIEQSTEWQRQ